MKKEIWMLQKKIYDRLFKNEKDPAAANLFYLVLEIENYYERRGIRPTFSNFTGSGEDLDNFLAQNKAMLQKLFAWRYKENPDRYSFRKKIENKKLDSILDGNFSDIQMKKEI
jgi:hypothetical protein